jgi:hypothetical protein
MLRKIFFGGLMFFMTSSVAFAAFSDVNGEHQYAKSINWMQANNVVVGYEDGSFRPDNKVNRAEFLKMLYETVGMENVDTQFSFPDVPENEWYAKYVKEAYATGVVDGYPDGTFRPASYINFAEAMKIVANAFFDVDYLYIDGIDYPACIPNLPKDIYPSVDNTSWYWPYVSVLDEFCVAGNFSANVWEMKDGLEEMVDFDVSKYVSRADMAEMLYRAKAVKDNDNLKYIGNLFPLDVNSVDVNAISYCTDDPEYLDNGRSVYPIDPKYVDLPFLGQLFTAANCGGTRVFDLFGVDGSSYTLGSRILLNGVPSEDFLTVFSLIGFECVEGSDCTEITLSDTVTVDEMLLLEPYYAEMSADDCTNCG